MTLAYQRTQNSEKVLLFTNSQDNKLPLQYDNITSQLSVKYGIKNIKLLPLFLTKIQNQSSLEDLISNNENEGIKIFIISNARNLFTQIKSERDLFIFLSAFSKLEVRFISLEDDVDMKTSSSGFILFMMKIYRDYTSDSHSKNVRNGIQLAKKNGKQLGRPVKRDTQKILNLRKSGLTIQKIADLLDLSIGSVHRSITEL